MGSCSSKSRVTPIVESFHHKVADRTTSLDAIPPQNNQESSYTSEGSTALILPSYDDSDGGSNYRDLDEY